MKPYYKKPPAPPSPPLPFNMKSNTQLDQALARLNELKAKAQPSPLIDIDAWLAKQAEEEPILLKMYAYAAKLARQRYESLIEVGFTPDEALQLVKIYLAQ